MGDPKRLAFVGQFNDRLLYCRKPVLAVLNMGVVFEDLSSIDMLTGKALGLAEEDFRVEPPFDGEAPAEQAIEKISTGPLTFVGNHLRIENAPQCTIEISEHSAPDITVTIEGEQDVVENITVQNQLNDVVINGKPLPSSGGVFGGNVISLQDGSFSQIVADNVSISQVVGGTAVSKITIGSQRQSRATITIKVPKGTKMTFRGEWYSVTAGDIEGNLEITASEKASAKFGKMNNVVANAQSKSSITIDDVTGTLRTRAEDKGAIKVLGGNISTLRAKSISQGSIQVAGKIAEVDLDAEDKGMITLNGTAPKTLKVSATSRSEIHVKFSSDLEESPTIEIASFIASDKGVVTATADKIKSLFAKMTDKGTLHVSKATIELAELTGADKGEIVVREGSIIRLTASATDRADITLRSTVQTANLRATNRGNILANNVVEKPTRQTSDRGTITVLNW